MDSDRGAVSAHQAYNHQKRWADTEGDGPSSALWFQIQQGQGWVES